ncbi:Leucine rich repeat-containing protein, partial [Prevotellaceae bacterium MN60]
CSGLTSVTIGNSVTSIGNRAFYDCSGLTSVTSLNPTPPRIYSNTFNLYTAVLNVPIGRKAAYKAANYWRDFTNIKEIDVAGVQGIQVDKDQNARVYDLNGRRLNAPTKGVGIINGRKVLMK